MDLGSQTAEGAVCSEKTTEEGDREGERVPKGGALGSRVLGAWIRNVYEQREATRVTNGAGMGVSVQLLRVLMWHGTLMLHIGPV